MNLRIVMGVVTGVFCGSMGLVTAAQAATPMEADAHGMHDMAMPAAVSETVAHAASAPAESDSTKAFKAANAKMHKGMMVPYTGDADVDFVRGMIPHHQGAVDMANTVIKYGSDADVRMMAGDIVKAQEKEIHWMQDWLAKHGPKDASASDARVEVPASVPQPVVSKDVKDIVTPVTVISAAEYKVSSTVVTSGTVPSVGISSTAPVVVTSATTAMMMDGMPMSMTPDLPAPDAAIPNEAPQMQFLDQPVATTVGDPTGGDIKQ